MRQTTQEVFLWTLPPIVKDFIYTEEYFRQFSIITEDMAEVDSDFNQRLSGILPGPTGKRGITILIQTCGGGGAIPNIPAAFNTRGRLVMVVCEVPVINGDTVRGGTGEPGLVVAEVLAATIKNFATTERNYENVHFYDSEVSIAPPEMQVDRDGEPTGLVAHAVTMHMPGGTVRDTRVVATPEIVCTEEGIVSFTCATEGATLFYTVNDTRPTDLNGSRYDAEAVFTQTQVVVGPVIVKVRAYFPGMRASLIASRNVAQLLTFESGDIIGSEGGAAAIPG